MPTKPPALSPETVANTVDEECLTPESHGLRAYWHSLVFSFFLASTAV
jgi:hypothetical protein